MPANVEIKARVQDLAQLISRVEQLSGSPGSLILQTDTFFPVPHGRLKVRDFRDGHGELVFYDRPNSTAPKLSRFTISPTDDPGGLVAALSQALGEQGVVKKARHLYTVGQTRVHVDQVEGLGDFVELEVVLEEQQSLQEGKEVAWQLMSELGIEEKDLIGGAYLDLLLAGGRGGGVSGWLHGGCTRTRKRKHENTKEEAGVASSIHNGSFPSFHNVLHYHLMTP